MKEKVQLIVQQYLKQFPEEETKILPLKEYLKKFDDEKIIDWNNQEGHLTVGAFVYCKEKDKFLVLYHKDLEMYLYPGGHVDRLDENLFTASKRELKEETGLENLEPILIDNIVLPFDIDIHFIPFNKRVNMPGHYHFDFRYLFLVDDMRDIIMDEEECKNYQWISSNELKKDKNYGSIINKIDRIL